MKETNHQAEFLISFPTKIAQKKREVTTSFPRSWSARTVKDLYKKHDSSALQAEALSDHSAAVFSHTPWQRISVITLMIGFDTVDWATKGSIWR